MDEIPALLVRLLDQLLGSALPGMTNLKAYLASPFSILFAIFMSFLSGPWSEEFGWRGFSLDPLLRRFGALRGSLISGVIWCVWHLPLYFMPQTWHGQMGFQFAGFWTFLVYTLGLTMIMTWVYSHTRSLLVGQLMHMVFTGAFIAFIPIPPISTEQYFAFNVVLAIVLWTNANLLAARHIYQRAGYRLVGSEPHHSFGHDLVGEVWELALEVRRA